jgi:hypothetical protein
MVLHYTTVLSSQSYFPFMSLHLVNVCSIHNAQTRSGVHPASHPVVMAALSSGVRRSGLETDHSPPSSAEVKNFGAVPPLPHTFSFHGAELIKLRDIFFSMVLAAHSGPRALIQFRNRFSQTAGLLGRGISPSQGHYLNTGQHKHRINTYTHQTSTHSVGFKPMIPASERAKIIHALDRAVTAGTTLPLPIKRRVIAYTCKSSHTK